MNFIVEERNQRVFSACFLILIGILMCLFTSFSAGVFVIVCGVMCIVFGCLYVGAYFATLLIHDPYLLMRGFFLLLLGSCILSDPGVFLYVVVFATSLFMMFMGVEELAYAVDLAKLHVKNWWIDLLYSILSLGLGIGIIVVEYTGGNSLAMVVTMAGAFLIFEGVFELVMIYGLHRDYRKTVKFFEQE
ncbi:MAG: DUF308 domain-containing protein [Bacilli bacterium]|jgi:uncharacterized membrane protein HdeD (DUF308 family)|nr:DUF308 domain-containing protein [Bacilli bacterium]